MAQYSWVETFGGTPPVPPETLGRWLTTFEQQHGRLPTRDDLVEAAAPPESPFHDCFEWDDAKAARAHRLDQASRIICKLHVEYVTPAGEVHTMRAFAPVTPPGRDRGFLSAERILSDPALREQMVRDALNDLAAFAAKFEKLLDHPAVSTHYSMLSGSVSNLARMSSYRRSA